MKKNIKKINILPILLLAILLVILAAIAYVFFINKPLGKFEFSFDCLKGNCIPTEVMPNIDEIEINKEISNPNINVNKPKPAKPDSKGVNTTTEKPPIVITDSFQYEAWIYPGEPACNAVKELIARDVDVVKIEYLHIEDNGSLTILTPSNTGCNGYSKSNLAILKRYSKEQYLTISGNIDSLRSIGQSSTTRKSFVNNVVSFVKSNNMSGVDIDIEQFDSWGRVEYDYYLKTIQLLGTKLHENGKKLQIDLPAIANSTIQKQFVLKYEDLNKLPIDQFTIMAYDYQYDYGAGKPVQPISWLKSVIDYSKLKFSSDSKISIGIPAYGYKGTCNQYEISILTLTQIKALPGNTNSIRDKNSYEMIGRSGNSCFVYSDSTTLNKKLEVIKSKGIKQVSVWHLGGNAWFTK